MHCGELIDKHTKLSLLNLYGYEYDFHIDFANTSPNEINTRCERHCGDGKGRMNKMRDIIMNNLEYFSTAPGINTFYATHRPSAPIALMHKYIIEEYTQINQAAIIYDIAARYIRDPLFFRTFIKFTQGDELSDGDIRDAGDEIYKECVWDRI